MLRALFTYYHMVVINYPSEFSGIYLIKNEKNNISKVSVAIFLGQSDNIV